MKTKFQRIDENVFKLVPEEDASVGNPGLEAEIRKMRNDIMTLVNRMEYKQLKELWQAIASHINDD